MSGDISMPTPTTAIDTPSLNPTTESVIIRESNGKYKKYNVFQAREQEEDLGWSDDQIEFTDKPKKEKDIPVVQGEPVNIVGEKASEEIRAVEKIIIKEKGKLKFKSVFTEVKKKA